MMKTIVTVEFIDREPMTGIFQNREDAHKFAGYYRRKINNHAWRSGGVREVKVEYL